MSSSAPPAKALAAIIGPESTVTRRIDIYESDATTFWKSARITSGAVSVDASRDERRTLDCTLENIDDSFDNYPGGLWYDKVFKVYRGVQYDDTSESWMSAPGSGAGTRIYTLDKSQLDIVGDIELQVEVTAIDYTPTAEQFLMSKWSVVAGNRSFAFSITASGALKFYWTTDGTTALTATSTVTAGLTDGTRNFLKVTFDVDNGASGRTVSFYKSADGLSWTQIGTSVTTATVTSIFSGTADLEVGSLSAGLSSWFAGKIHSAVVRSGIGGSIAANPTMTNLVNGVASFVDDYLNSWIVTGTASILGGLPITSTWETQIGEFILDNIETQNFDHTTHVTGRDYTKKLKEDDFLYATTFAAGSRLGDVIKAIALNGGITKFIVPFTIQTLGKDFAFESGTTRWKAMTDVATAYGYEVFFDASGYLVLREFQDPSTSPLTFTFDTGSFGTLVNYKKSATDSLMYNTVHVIGGATNQTPVYAKAENHEPSSPTSIENFRRRKSYRYTSTFITTIAQAQDVATKFLKVMSLEAFTLSMTSICLPWIDVGEIVGFIDPDPNPGDPTRFLLHDLTIPLALGGMTGSAKRVTIVG